MEQEKYQFTKIFYLLLKKINIMAEEKTRYTDTELKEFKEIINPSPAQLQLRQAWLHY